MHHPHLTLGHRLLAALGVVSFLFWAVMATLSTRDNIKEINELYDVHLAYTTKAFLHLMDPDDDEQQNFPSTLSATAVAQLLDLSPNLASRPALDQLNNSTTLSAENNAPSTPLNTRKQQFNQSLRYQLWRDSGELLFRSENAPLDHMAKLTGFSDTLDTQGGGWRNYYVHDPSHSVHMIVSEPHEFREHLARSMVISAATPLVIGLPILFLLLWFSVKRGLYPLASLSSEIAKRQPDNLTLINAQNVPDEVLPMVMALNDLLQRMGQTLENERQFTDDAAHQLRTPLAAIQAQLYTARHTQAGTAAHQLALNQMHESVARGIRLVNQLLALARLDPKQSPPDYCAIQLEPLAESICAELAPLTLQRDQTLELIAPPHLPEICGNADLLTMLVSNLLDNAIHYTPQGGHIILCLEPTAGAVCLSVSDDGPGIAPDQRSKVFERFYRVATQNQPGTGLGLAICKRVAELHHTTLELSEGIHGRGLCVTVPLAICQEPSEIIQTCK
ncbi:MAG: two-component system OmpR family sensor histidine kinase QseC [Comamonadaceae bacterium]|nr:MAG: two-component system OmpR family sensor histidine kinase QseC [Comamonadaceae bacterium]